jgi:micrococcal nuclease
VGVHDGDSITLLTSDKKQIKIRLEGIDAPELGQPFGKEAKKAMSDLVFGKHVVIHDHGLDIYKRTLGRVICEGLDVNLEMVKQGMAWRFRRYNNELSMRQAEAGAREAKRGLWADKGPVPPWEWRKEKRDHEQQKP